MSDDSAQGRFERNQIKNMSKLIFSLKSITLLGLTTIILFHNMVWTHGTGKSTIEIIHPSINKPFSGAKSAAGYVTIINHTDEELKLLGVSTTLGKAMLHKTITTDDGIVKMEHKMKISIPATGKLIMKPGSFHIMIMGISRSLALGEKIPATLRFNGDLEINIEFVVEAGKEVSTVGRKPEHNH